MKKDNDFEKLPLKLPLLINEYISDIEIIYENGKILFSKEISRLKNESKSRKNNNNDVDFIIRIAGRVTSKWSIINKLGDFDISLHESIPSFLNYMENLIKTGDTPVMTEELDKCLKSIFNGFENSDFTCNRRCYDKNGNLDEEKSDFLSDEFFLLVEEIARFSVTYFGEWANQHSKLFKKHFDL